MKISVKFHCSNRKKNICFYLSYLAIYYLRYWQNFVKQFCKFENVYNSKTLERITYNNTVYNFFLSTMLVLKTFQENLYNIEKAFLSYNYISYQLLNINYLISSNY